MREGNRDKIKDKSKEVLVMTICTLCRKEVEKSGYGITLSKKTGEGRYRSRGIYGICNECGEEIEEKINQLGSGD